jgi:ABC-2 type transport system ATP-binding protein
MSEPAIRVEGLSRRFGGLRAVSNLSFQVEPGCVCGFLGRNGSGKTTTIRMLMGFSRPSGGRAQLLGLDPQHDRPELMRRVGYVGEAPVMPEWMTVREVADFTGSFYQTWDADRVNGLLERSQLNPEQKVGHLSRGMNAQLALVLALGHNPELLILDEPATGLDVLVRRSFLEGIIDLIQQEGRTVLVSSHLVHEVERVADQIVVIEGGRLVVSKSLEELKREARGQSLEEIFVDLVSGRALNAGRNA